MKAADIMARFTQLDKDQQACEQWEKQLQGLETAVRQLEATRQQWQNQITWKDGLNLTLAELQQRHHQLEEQARLWATSRRSQQPDVALGEWQTAVQQAQSHIAALTAQEQALQQLETLWTRWQRVAAKQALAHQISDIEAQWQAEQQQEAALLTAYDELQTITTEVQTYKEQIAAIERMIQELDQAIAGDQKATWLALAFNNVNALSQDIGGRLYTIEENTQTSQAQSEALQKEVVEVDQTLEPDRQRVAALQAEEKVLRGSFARLPQELSQWGQDSNRLKMAAYLQSAKVDGESETELKALWQRMEPELRHLQWFKEQVASL